MVAQFKTEHWLKSSGQAAQSGADYSLTDGLCLFQSKNSMIVISTIKDVAIDERK